MLDLGACWRRGEKRLETGACRRRGQGKVGRWAGVGTTRDGGGEVGAGNGRRAAGERGEERMEKVNG